MVRYPLTGNKPEVGKYVHCSVASSSILGRVLGTAKNLTDAQGYKQVGKYNNLETFKFKIKAKGDLTKCVEQQCSGIIDSRQGPGDPGTSNPAWL